MVKQDVSFAEAAVIAIHTRNKAASPQLYLSRQSKWNAMGTFMSRQPGWLEEHEEKVAQQGVFHVAVFDDGSTVWWNYWQDPAACPTGHTLTTSISLFIGAFNCLIRPKTEQPRALEVHDGPRPHVAR